MNQTTAGPLAASSRDRALAIAVIASFVVCYAGVLSSLVHRWSTSDMYAHGFLIPFISGYMMWTRKDRLAALPARPDVLSGTVVLAAGLAALLVGQFGSLLVVQQLSLIVTLAGLVLLLFGWQMLRETWVPLAYLLFMIPVWEVVTGPLHAPFQRLSAQIGTVLMRLVGIPVRLEGVFLELPTATLEVAQACSGVNFVVAILAIGIPQSYLMLSSPALRVFIAAYAVVVALLTNGLRVAFIGALSYNGLTGSDIHGPGHALQGMSVAVIGFLIVFATIQLLARREHARSGSAATTAPPVRRVNGFAPRLAIVACVILLATPGLGALRRPSSVEPREALDGFPLTLGSWRASGLATRPAGLTAADEEMARTYTNTAGRSVTLYVGYFRRQAQGKEIVSDGMSALHGQSRPVSIAGAGGRSVAAAESLQDGRNGATYNLFWYDLNGRATSNRMTAKALTIWQSLAAARNNGAVVVLRTPVPSGADRAAIASDTQELARLSAAALATYLPQ